MWCTQKMFFFYPKHICWCKTSCLWKTCSFHLTIRCWILVSYRKFIFYVAYFHNLFARSKCRATVTECYKFRISNEELLRRLNLKEIYYYSTKTQLRGAGHIAGRDFDRVREKCCLRGHVINTPGAPEFTFGHGLYKSLTKAGVNVKNCHALALDKSKWRKVLRCDT